MEYVHAVVLGIIQGVAELFPISSAAHTLLISYLFGWTLPSLPFVVMLHLGTFLAVLVYFARDYTALVKGFFTGFFQGFRKPEQRLALLIILGTIPLALIGKAFERQFDALFASPLFAAVFLLVTGFVLYAVERLSRAAKPQALVNDDTLDPSEARYYFPPSRAAMNPPAERAEQLSWRNAFLIGLSQIGGLFPGGSRSGFSIAAGMLAGLSRAEAARFSFLLAGLAIFGASIFELRRVIHPKAAAAASSGVVQHGIANVSAAPEATAVIVLGFIVAFGSGLLAIRYFMRYLSDHKLTPFAIYCWLFGLLMIFVIIARRHAGV
ncbi:MAG: undecaprenyl-diphosphate phosphatase [Candidatus Eremiobacteraeota bacterium]|nr:undecaprenyl-diphosphate phosphatase [Candidatus Eremiobacteraeota bacterium]